MAEDEVVAVGDAAKSFGSGGGEVRALDGVSLRMARGEFVALCGPSGSGKSTLLHLCGGLIRPTAGTVVTCGRDLATLTPAELCELRRSDVGYVFQRDNLVPSLTAAENVSLPLEFDGLRPARARRAAHAALERVGLPMPFDRFPDDLSGGEQQRVAIARAIARPRRLVLADEPTGALDSLTAGRVLDLFADLAAAGTAVLLVTHEPRFAALADRVLFLRDGRIVDDSTAALAALRAIAAS
jgi:putative ABC transport system ATP-binding protein